MNKQEAIEKIYTASWDDSDYEGLIVNVETVNEIIFQIDESQKVVVPKYISDKIEYCKDTEGYGLFHAMDYCYNYKDSAEWLEYNQETFARAWLDGYEIEQEKLYTVEIPNPESVYPMILYKNDGGRVILGTCYTPENWKKLERNQLTESEIKQDFDWAWQFREEVD